MREKKFRAWDKVTETYLYSDKFPSPEQLQFALKIQDYEQLRITDLQGDKE